MTGIEPMLLGTAASGVAGTAAATAATAGLFGVGGSFALGTTLGTLGTVASLGSTFLGLQAQNQSAQAAEISNRTNLAIDESNSYNQEVSARREQYLRTGANIAAAGAGGTTTGSTLDVLADNAAQDELNIIGIRKNLSLTQDVASARSSSAKKANKLNSYAGILSGGVDAYKTYKGL